MLTEINAITQQFFQKEDLDSVSKEELENFIGKYPYNASARLLLAQKEFNGADSPGKEEILTAGLYINNPLWLDWLLTGSLSEPGENTDQQPTPVNDQPEPAHITAPGEVGGSSLPIAEVAVDAPATEQEAPASQPPATKSPQEEPLIAFQSYHTIDYFASQGIRLQQAELGKDRLGQQLKSFTEWLRSMKKIHAGDAGQRATAPDESVQLNVIRTAEASIQDKEIVTEAMAEVWIKQGHPEKAIDIYNKLSLLDPPKSAYFASKIDQLK